MSSEETEESAVNGACPVVGIGASAGGLEAFTLLLKALPETTGMAFVLVQHLDPDHPSILAELLAGHTSMPVRQATEGIQVEPNHVYVIPPNSAMAIRNGILRLTPRGEERGRHLPIDYFLCSLSEDHKSRAIGVVLSGSASDGTIGLKAIKSAGGITFAQDQTAKFDSMPRSAIAAGVVDFVLAPRAIAREIAGIAHHAYLESGSAHAQLKDGKALEEILALLRNSKGVDFTHYKGPTIQRRISRRIALRHVDTPESYLTQLHQDPGEIHALFDDLLINVTEFFRDPPMFDVLASTAFPVILKGRKPDEVLRIWVPGCSSGEEVYSIAIVLSEYLERTHQSFPIQIFGTDISERAIESARSGKYPESIVAFVSPERLKRFFIKLEGGAYQIIRSIRESCVFSRHDLTKDPPFSRMDLVSCRNLLIYLGPVLQRRVVSAFGYALQPSGCLLLGRSESLGSMADHFLPLDRDHKIYARNLRVTPPAVEFYTPRTPAFANPLPRDRRDEIITVLDREADRLVSEDYGPSGLLIDADHQVLRFRGNVGFYIAPPTGVATLEVFKLVREDLVPILRTALDEAATQGIAVRKDHVPIRRNDRSEEICIVVRPVTRLGTDRSYLVLFEEVANQESRELAQTRNAASLLTEGRDLSDELVSTRTYLQSLIEELRSANEEAQSANEELQSTNEELQTAKEELQSSNEELTTTNDEMNNRNSELRQVNNDLMNLLSSMQAPIVMLNKELRIRRFTPLAEKTLNLIATDVGRPLTDIKPRIQVPDLEKLLAKVIDSVQALEQEVQDQDGRWYSMRINPYRTANNAVEGAVLQLLDIDQLKRTLESAEQARAYSQAIFETVREPLVVLDHEMRVQTANTSFFDTFHIAPDRTLNQSIFELDNHRWDSPKIRQLLEETASPNLSRSPDVEVEAKTNADGWRTFQLNARLLKRDASPNLILLALEDVTARKRTAEAKYRRVFETAKDGILIIDADTGDITDSNPFVAELFGYTREDLVGKKFWQAGPLSGVPDGPDALARLRAENVVRFPDSSAPSKDGRHIEIEAVGNIYTEGEKQVIQFNIRDITERKYFDRQLQQTAELESLGLLAGGVAHDFNNLLTGILGNASLVLESVPSNSTDREYLREIVKASQRAADLTRQMLAYSGRGRFVIELVDLSELVRDISVLVRSSIPKSVDIELNLAQELPSIEADPIQVQQIIMNLVINAAEAIGEANRGAVRVTTSKDDLDAEFLNLNFPAEEIRPGVYVILDVTDSGAGMDETTKARIFDPFFTTKFTGRGLGLSAVLGIVRGHRGAIRVYSAPGQSTTFRVLFPAAIAARAPKPQEPLLEELHGSGLILVADDEEMVLRLATPALQRFGYSVLTAPNGEVAVRLVRERGHEIKLVVLDLTMPIMGGEQALNEIKNLRPGLPVVLSSGYDEGQAVKRFANRDLAAFIQKPYSIRKLLEVVKSTIRPSP